MSFFLQGGGEERIFCPPLFHCLSIIGSQSKKSLRRFV